MGSLMISGQWCTMEKMHSAMEMGQQLSPKIQSSRILLVKDMESVTRTIWSYTASINAVSVVAVEVWILMVLIKFIKLLF